METITPAHLVAQALRVDHCSTGLKARVVVCETPEKLAATAIDALRQAGLLKEPS